MNINSKIFITDNSPLHIACDCIAVASTENMSESSSPLFQKILEHLDGNIVDEIENIYANNRISKKANPLKTAEAIFWRKTGTLQHLEGIIFVASPKHSKSLTTYPSNIVSLMYARVFQKAAENNVKRLVLPILSCKFNSVPEIVTIINSLRTIRCCVEQYLASSFNFPEIVFSFANSDEFDFSFLKSLVELYFPRSYESFQNIQRGFVKENKMIFTGNEWGFIDYQPHESIMNVEFSKPVLVTLEPSTTQLMTTKVKNYSLVNFTLEEITVMKEKQRIFEEISTLSTTKDMSHCVHTLYINKTNYICIFFNRLNYSLNNVKHLRYYVYNLVSGYKTRNQRYSLLFFYSNVIEEINYLNIDFLLEFINDLPLVELNLLQNLFSIHLSSWQSFKLSAKIKYNAFLLDNDQPLKPNNIERKIFAEKVLNIQKLLELNEFFPIKELSKLNCLVLDSILAAESSINGQNEANNLRFLLNN
eukprot:TRINITY_DN1840_c0_g1_i1.p1 TRINITY_DN1840_c0_g1~~TRINITY_DN1840_c0_g1_i1.p1  ORF type:complete len:557 (-),score=123.74 TRINITY_DN1840_c0_g1_i1:25-1452(-)